jgi:hypothetical protein
MSLKTRAKLSVEQVISIYQIKHTLHPASKVGLFFGVSEKTVRDIWRGRTWTNETWHLDTSRIVVQKSIGRPKGARDSRPRICRTEKRNSNGHVSSLKATDPATRSSRIEGNKAGSAITCWSHPKATPNIPENRKLDNQSLQHSVQSCFLRIEEPSQPPTASSATHSVDQQLHEWGQALWLDLEAADPFRTDWILQQEFVGSEY